MQSFEYFEAKSLEEVVQTLASGEEVRVLAGGCGILLLMKQNLYFPQALVNIKKIPGLKYIEQNNGTVRIGPLATHNEVKGTPLVEEKLPLLSEALGYVATNRIRNMATIGGTLAHADPTSDAAPALLALEAKVVVMGSNGEQEIELAAFFKDYFETILESGEVLKEIIVPLPPETAKGFYTRFEVRKAMDKAMPGVAVLIDLAEDKKTIRTARIGLSGVGNRCLRLEEAEEFLTGKEDHPDIRQKIGDIIKATIDPVEEYNFTVDYKKQIAAVFLQRVFAEAYSRASSSS
ncbi:MAG: xanthine dehydrogenase family protein subunit M [Desulfobacteraceae bacterium]|jgi:carbon-monoxide dehydrogenase medium subunit|nr:xanthine dehydrogenase family protein subunit M [Desulfobacterales bacterium]MDH3956460.1 xanthine dehydrogenase family protein subunit M [Desulfobacteraceae bacterium]